MLVRVSVRVSGDAGNCFLVKLKLKLWPSSDSELGTLDVVSLPKCFDISSRVVSRLHDSEAERGP